MILFAFLNCTLAFAVDPNLLGLEKQSSDLTWETRGLYMNTLKLVTLVFTLIVLPNVSMAAPNHLLVSCKVTRYPAELPKVFGFAPTKARIAYSGEKRVWFFEVTGKVGGPNFGIKATHSISLASLTNTATQISGADSTGDNWFSLKPNSANPSILEGSAGFQEDFGLTLQCRKFWKAIQ